MNCKKGDAKIKDFQRTPEIFFGTFSAPQIFFSFFEKEKVSILNICCNPGDNVFSLLFPITMRQLGVSICKKFRMAEHEKGR